MIKLGLKPKSVHPRSHTVHATCCLFSQAEDCTAGQEVQLGWTSPWSGLHRSCVSSHPSSSSSLTFCTRDTTFNFQLLVVFQESFVYLTAKSVIVSSQGAWVVAFSALSVALQQWLLGSHQRQGGSDFFLCWDLALPWGRTSRNPGSGGRPGLTHWGL